MKLFVTCSRVLIVILSTTTGVCGATERTSEGGVDISVRDEATPTDAGLPTYPGSKPYKNADQTSSSANIGFSIPGLGLKVVAMNLESDDKPERVAAFYRKALSKYGQVLDCSDAAKNKQRSRDEAAAGIVCDPDDPGANSIVYKVGTDANHRIAAMRPHGSGTRFSLVHVDKRDPAAK